MKNSDVLILLEERLHPCIKISGFDNYCQSRNGNIEIFFFPEVCDVSDIVSKQSQPSPEPQSPTDPPPWGSSIVKVPSGLFDTNIRTSSNGKWKVTSTTWETVSPCSQDEFLHHAQLQCL